MPEHEGQDFVDLLRSSDGVLSVLARATRCSSCQLDILSLSLCLLVKLNGYDKQDMLNALAEAFDKPEVNAIITEFRALDAAAKH